MNSEIHFNNIARDYDFWKQKNWYYYNNLIALYQMLIPPGQQVLEIGCGTGDILSALDVDSGKGIDISQAMIDIAKHKYPSQNLTFERHDIYDSDEIFNSDYVFLADVLEHVHDLPRFIAVLAKRLRGGSRVIISVANPLWEPILMLAEKLKMKMPEGPHERFSIKTNEQIFRANGLILEQRGYRLLVPKKLPGADFINQRFFKSWLLSRLGFTVFWVLKKPEV